MWTSSKLFRHFFSSSTLTRLVVLGMIGIFATTAYAQSRKTLRLVSTAWSPFTNETGKARFAIEIVHTALERAGITEVTTIVEDGELTPALLKGDYDGSPALWKDSEREKTLLYSQPYLENRLIVVGRQGSDVSATTFAGLNGKRIALVESYGYGDAIGGTYGLIYVPSVSEEESLQKVLHGEADYTLMDELVMENVLKNFPNEARTRLAFGLKPLLVRSLCFAVRRDLPDAAAIIDRFNSGLHAMVADNTYIKLLQVDWLEADVDGDGVAEYVSRNETVGAEPPEHVYKLLTLSSQAEDSAQSKRYYVGGKFYQNWTSVPDQFKLAGPNDTVSGGTKFSIFNFKF